MSFTCTPASASLRIETICVSVNLDFFIAASWRFDNARKLYFSSVSFQGKLTPKVTGSNPAPATNT